MLNKLKEALRQLIEDEYALGNRVYEDDEGVHFLVADIDWGEELTTKVREVADELTDGEIQPSVKLNGPTRRVTDLVSQMKRAREEVPLASEPAWVQKWKDTASGEVCPVCRRRPLEGDRELCEWCEHWRGEGIKARRAWGAGTVWTGEIADSSGRVALVVARFDLRRWLDGTLLHTLFINSPQDVAAKYQEIGGEADWNRLYKGVQKWLAREPLKPIRECRQALLGAQKQLRQAEDHSIPSNRRLELRQQAEQKIQKAQEQLWAGLVGQLLSQYEEKERYVCETAKELEKAWGLSPFAALLLALARKNPSASRLLRIWQTTEEFLINQAEGLKGLVRERERLVFALDPQVPSGLYTADVPGLGQVDLFVRFEDGKAQTVAWLNPDRLAQLPEVGSELGTIHLRSSRTGRILDTWCKIQAHEQYFPFQVITASPNLLLAMVPAEVAMEVAAKLQQAYTIEFGKVQGRLPFHIGLIFMDAHYPMFAALDAARRLAETFDSLGEKVREAVVEEIGETDQGYTLSLTSDRFGTWAWRIPVRRGDGEVDWYHPYLLVKAGDGVEKRGMSLAGPFGRWVHVSQVKKGDRIAFWPGLFDFIFLDTVSRRLEASMQTDHRPSTYCSLRPHLLERLTELEEVWNAICTIPGVSEASLQGAATLLARKWKLWDCPTGREHREEWEWLVDNVVARHFNGSEVIRHAVMDGTFFDAVELYRHILKRKVKEFQGEEVER